MVKVKQIGILFNKFSGNSIQTQNFEIWNEVFQEKTSTQKLLYTGKFVWGELVLNMNKVKS